MFGFLADLFKAKPAHDDETLQAILQEFRSLGLPTIMMDGSSGRTAMRLGGSPRLPATVPWPCRTGEPLTFLAELDLSAIREADGPDWLPPEGYLHVFYDTDAQLWGFDPADGDGVAAIMTPDRGDAPTQRPVGRGQGWAFTERALKPRRTMSFPSLDRLDSADRGASRFDIDLVDDLLATALGDAAQHHVGGYPSPIQNDDMELEGQLASAGVNVGGPGGYESDRAKALEPGKSDWKLLLQIDSDDEADMMWGDVGRLYIWVREEDARAGDFSKVWLILQCS